MTQITRKRKSLFQFLTEKNYSFQTQANFEFRWPLLFGDNSFLIDTISFPEVDTNILYMYLDGYQIPVLGTPKFENNLRIAIWVPEPFMETYNDLFNEVIKHGKFDSINNSTAFIIPLSNDSEEISKEIKNELDMSYYKMYYDHKRMDPYKRSFHDPEPKKPTSPLVIRLFDTQLKSISSDEFSSTSQSLHHITLSLVYSAFDTNDASFGITQNLTKWDFYEKHSADNAG